MSKRRFAYVGTGGRSRMFIDPAASTYRDMARIVGLCDSSLVRARYHRDRLKGKFNYDEVPVFSASEFGQMLEGTRPEKVVVCSMDSTHDQYIVESLQNGVDVVTEKPMTIDAYRCQRILDAVRQTGRSVQVAFNYRWAPGATKVREVLAANSIGVIRQVNMEYLLNTRHGADYFRRWHAEKRNSGGLLVHKSTHHFDLINWWIDSIPEEVFAKGALAFYGRENAVRRGDHAYTAYPRYFGSQVKGDPFAYKFEEPVLGDVDYETALYLKAEAESGYIRDRNVFRDGIDVEDVMNVMVTYRNGVFLNYSLNAFSPFEGFRVTFSGDRGRLEYEELHGAHVLDLNGKATTGDEHAHSGGMNLRIFPHFKEGFSISIEKADGGHGGGDPLLQEQIFSLLPSQDSFGRSAGHEQGTASIMVGIAANESIASGMPQRISKIVDLKPQAIRLSELT